MAKQDPLAAMLARKQISQAQHAAGRRWLQADAEALARCRAYLGDEGNALLGLVLGGQSLIAIATARGFDARPGSRDLVYLGRRLRECLDELTEALARPTLRQRGLRFRNSPVRQIETA
jgi:hypothetical protein